MRRIDHISDLHFGRVDDAVVAGLLAELNAAPADLVAVSGDLTMRARRREYAAAAEFLRALKAPWIAVPGNHDIPYYDPWERFTNPYARWRRFIQDDIEPAWVDQEIAVLGLNTVSRGGLRMNWADGTVHLGGLSRLLERLRALPDGTVRIIVAHHPFLAPPWAPDTVLAGRARKALAVLSRAGVRLVLSGHLHRTYTSQYENIVAEGSGLQIVSAGSATSVRLRNEVNTYNRITIAPGGIDCEPRAWNGQGWERLELNRATEITA